MDILPSIPPIPSPPEPSQPPAPTTTWLSRYRSLLLVVVPILTLALGVGLGFLLWGSGGKSASQAEIATAVKGTQRVLNPPPQNVKRYDVPVDDDPAYGPANAPITIIEFSDYQ
jgi:protein-disulfide isomerase